MFQVQPKYGQNQTRTNPDLSPELVRNRVLDLREAKLAHGKTDDSKFGSRHLGQRSEKSLDSLQQFPWYDAIKFNFGILISSFI